MYKHILKPILFRFNPETAHNLTFHALSFLRYIPFSRSIIRAIYHRDSPALSREVFGINFPNPVGLAGGLDKNGEFYKASGWKPQAKVLEGSGRQSTDQPFRNQ